MAAVSWFDVLVTRRRAKLISKLKSPYILYEELGDAKHRTVFAGAAGQVINNADTFVKTFIQNVRSGYLKLRKWSDEEIALEIMRHLDADQTSPRLRTHERYLKRLRDKNHGPTYWASK